LILAELEQTYRVCSQDTIVYKIDSDLVDKDSAICRIFKGFVF